MLLSIGLRSAFSSTTCRHPPPFFSPVSSRNIVFRDYPSDQDKGGLFSPVIKFATDLKILALHLHITYTMCRVQQAVHARVLVVYEVCIPGFIFSYIFLTCPAPSPSYVKSVVT